MRVAVIAPDKVLVQCQRCGQRYRVRAKSWRSLRPMCGQWLTDDHTARGAQCGGECVEIHKAGGGQCTSR